MEPVLHIALHDVVSTNVCECNGYLGGAVVVQTKHLDDTVADAKYKQEVCAVCVVDGEALMVCVVINEERLSVGDLACFHETAPWEPHECHDGCSNCCKHNVYQTSLL